MRMQELKINVDGKLALDIMKLPENCVIILSQGKPSEVGRG